MYSISAEDVYRTEKSYSFHGNLLSMDSANDNLAQREMRKAMNSEYPGKPASNAADLARINAGAAGDEFKAPTVVYKSVKIAVEVKEDTNNSRTIQDYEWQKRTEETISRYRAYSHTLDDYNWTLLTEEKQRQATKDYISILPEPDRTEYYWKLISGDDPYKELYQRFFSSETVIPIVEVNNYFSALTGEGILYDINAKYYPHEWHTLTHEIAHAVDKASGWMSHDLGDVIIKDITQNITKQTEKTYISALAKSGQTPQEIGTLVKNQMLTDEVGQMVDYILDPKNNIKTRYDPYPDSMSNIQEKTLTSVKKYYQTEFGYRNPENTPIGDVYAGLTNGYFYSYLHHDGIALDGSSYWYDKKGDLKSGYLCAEFFADVVPPLYIGSDDDRNAIQHFFPQSYPAVLATIEEMNEYLRK